jgi:DNA-binding response OmpR family regulator
LVAGDGRLQGRVERLARSADWMLQLAHDGREALLHIDATPPAMMLVSAKLASPGPSGFEICRRLSERAPKACSILVLSRVSTEARLAAFEAHADDCLEEPLDSRELSARANALARRCDLPLPFLVREELKPAASRPSPLVQQRAAILARRYGLSPKQERIVALVASGVCLKEVGTACGCLDSTVRTHLRRISAKLDCAGTREILIHLFSFDA